MFNSYWKIALLSILVVGVVMFVFSNITKTKSESSTWLDPQTGLEWQRCSMGQKWTGADCEGAPILYTWDEAQFAATTLGKGWQLPVMSELASLYRCSKGFGGSFDLPTRSNETKLMPATCKDGSSLPTIDTVIFPNTSSEKYWSASPSEDLSGNIPARLASKDSKYVWGADFGNHLANIPKSFKGVVLAVRTNQ